jgi:hypothetical protein
MVFVFAALPHLWYHSATEGRRMNTLNAIALLVPTVAVFIGILMNRQETFAIRAELRSVEASLRGEIKSVETTMRAEMIQLRKDINADMLQLRKDLTADMAQLRKDLNADMVQLRNGIHSDMVGLHERIAVVEAKQQS